MDGIRHRPIGRCLSCTRRSSCGERASCILHCRKPLDMVLRCPRWQQAHPQWGGGSRRRRLGSERGGTGTFERLHNSATAADRNATEEADICQQLASHKFPVLLWLRRQTKEHMRGPQKDEICASFCCAYKMPTVKRCFLMINILSNMLLEAHGWCFDGGECILTWPRHLALSRFYTAGVPEQNMCAFEPKKEPARSSLTLATGSSC